MNPNLSSYARDLTRTGTRLPGGDFKSSPALNEINHLARRRSSGAAVSGSERQRAEARWLPIWLPLLALALAGCRDDTRLEQLCRAEMAWARTFTDSVAIARRGHDMLSYGYHCYEYVQPSTPRADGGR